MVEKDCGVFGAYAAIGRTIGKCVARIDDDKEIMAREEKMRAHRCKTMKLLCNAEVALVTKCSKTMFIR